MTSSGRRPILRKLGVAALGAGVGLAALPSPPDASPVDAHVDPAPLSSLAAEWAEITVDDEDASPIARYQYRAAEGVGDGYVATAPVNVVFVPAEETGGLERTMAVLADAGWVAEPEEYTRYAWDRERERYVRQQATAAETYYGTSGRLHVRCWYFEGVVSMQAHEDTGARPKHGIASYERGRRAMEGLYERAGWDVTPVAIDLDNPSDPDHDGFATVITEPEAAAPPAGEPSTEVDP
ncbi:hypothetical protein OB905_08450 [Halobacteria archaeon AArc-dxtr1]|nr:hypothetical protein [Halobacteria archaeon AArc-dxtr1]